MTVEVSQQKFTADAKKFVCHFVRTKAQGMPHLNDMQHSLQCGDCSNNMNHLGGVEGLVIFFLLQGFHFNISPQRLPTSNVL